MSGYAIRILVQPDFKPGDLPPDGYLAWHEWAEVQRKAGIKQVMCPRCGKWRTPQELSSETVTSHPRTSRGERITATKRLCLNCAPHPHTESERED